MDSKNIQPMTIALVAAVGAAGFFGGMKYENYQTTKNRTQILRQFQGSAMNGQGGQFAQRGTRSGNGGRPVAGEILSIDEKTMTVKLPDGSSKIIILSEKATLNKATEATKADLKTGERVSVFGSENADGSITALNIQLNPMIRMGNVTPTTK